MEAELDVFLGYEKNYKGDIPTPNKRNGYSKKKLKSQYGEFQIDVPRDLCGEFEPVIIPKYQHTVVRAVSRKRKTPLETAILPTTASTSRHRWKPKQEQSRKTDMMRRGCAMS